MSGFGHHHGHHPDHGDARAQAHGHGHGHGHGHEHGHSHGQGSHGRAFAVAVLLNAGFVVAEVIASFASGSAALLADAGHNLGDVLSLLLAWGASVLAARPAGPGFTYGLKSSSILAAIANAALLWVALGAVLIETLRRFWQPQPVDGGLMMVVAAIGIAINLGCALLFARGRKSDLNLRAAFLHLVADAVVSASVVFAGLAILLTGRTWIDPVASLIITLGLAWSSWGLLRDAVKMGLLAVPGHIDEGAVRRHLSALPGVERIHDLHIWPMSTTEVAFTAHLVMPGGHPGDSFLKELAHELDHRFGIHHATIQVECDEDGCSVGHGH
ncbi:MAG TPA: cation diffusion facilitator family transporter [Novosphingobium sp.]|jgi:cobalt-zinc-cadmium efflux system protein|nr:cation diffusion facilitator family transporter [Novosphingobium sp.]HOA48900.1 cation diffusion facilitator family transporter [Novosphingobium sp.]HPZ48066.1 cation diffusion facilitator family transporter [Novosphingobium sp.]HQE00652.1 cation diffusion facilitator family transporter [Novosphingobium sp.]HQQ09551.1 cation diffusion facilitator family transporter [Novosphingobium sp.]